MTPTVTPYSLSSLLQQRIPHSDMKDRAENTITHPFHPDYRPGDLRAALLALLRSDAGRAFLEAVAGGTLNLRYVRHRIDYDADADPARTYECTFTEKRFTLEKGEPLPLLLAEMRTVDGSNPFESDRLHPSEPPEDPVDRYHIHPSLAADPEALLAAAWTHVDALAHEAAHAIIEAGDLAELLAGLSPADLEGDPLPF